MYVNLQSALSKNTPAIVVLLVIFCPLTHSRPLFLSYKSPAEFPLQQASHDSYYNRVHRDFIWEEFGDVSGGQIVASLGGTLGLIGSLAATVLTCTVKS